MTVHECFLKEAGILISLKIKDVIVFRGNNRENLCKRVAIYARTPLPQVCDGIECRLGGISRRMLHTAISGYTIDGGSPSALMRSPTAYAVWIRTLRTRSNI